MTIITDFWFWMIVLASLAVNVGVYYYRVKKAPAEQRTFLRVYTGLTQAMVFTALLMFSIPVASHYYDPQETNLQETTKLFSRQDQQITQIDAGLRRIQIAAFGILFSLCFVSFVARAELPNAERDKETEIEGPITLGLSNK